MHWCCVGRSRYVAVENINDDVDRALTSLGIARVLAQVDIVESNSLIEAFWSRLKHAWLYLHTLDSLAAATRLVTHFVEQHNAVMPHAAFEGHTPDEVFFATQTLLGERLKRGCVEARQRRFDSNRNAECGACRPTDAEPQGGVG